MKPAAVNRSRDLLRPELLQRVGQEAAARLGDDRVLERRALERQRLHADAAGRRVRPDRRGAPRLEVQALRPEGACRRPGCRRRAASQPPSGRSPPGRQTSRWLAALLSQSARKTAISRSASSSARAGASARGIDLLQLVPGPALRCPRPRSTGRAWGPRRPRPRSPRGPAARANRLFSAAPARMRDRRGSRCTARASRSACGRRRSPGWTRGAWPPARCAAPR